MSIKLKFRFLIMLATGLLLQSCQTAVAPEFGMVDWYIANGTSNRLTVNVYDKICGKSHFRIRVSTSADTPITTCANSEGNAEIRYQRTGGVSISENPMRNDVVSSNQSLLVR